MDIIELDIGKPKTFLDIRKSREEVIKYNDNHDPKSGRFAPKSGGASGFDGKKEEIISLLAQGTADSSKKADSLRAELKISRFSEEWKNIKAEADKLKQPQSKKETSVKTEKPKTENSKENAKVDERKEKQLEIINNSNPMKDDYHTGIRSAKDILNAKEAFIEDDFIGTPDWTYKDAQKALDSNKVTVYSSYPIENGVFVSPSKMMASEYAGSGKVYSKDVSVDDVAWIDSAEGQFANIGKSMTFLDMRKNRFNEPETEKETFQIMKSDDDKREVFGWALVAVRKDGSQIVDHQKDVVDPDELENAAYNYVLEFRDTGEMHDSKMRKKGKLIESVVFTKEKMKAMGIPEGILPEAGWWVGFKIEDNEAWDKIKSGKYRMFSIEGQGIRQEMED